MTPQALNIVRFGRHNVLRLGARFNSAKPLLYAGTDYQQQNLNRMNKYRKIPVEVEAVQFTDKTKDIVYAWAKSIQGNVFHDWDENKKPILRIPTLEGEMVCSLGDYLIKEPFPTDWRKLYPCKQTIFEQSYEAVI